MFNRKIFLKLFILIIFSIVSIVFAYNDYFLYKRPILKINKIVQKVEESDMTSEKHITQTIYGTIKNGKYKGKKIKVLNNTTTSGVFDDQVHKGSELFVELHGNSDTAIGISQIKRDKYLVILLVIFIDSIVLVAGNKGIKTLLSLFLNILISALAIFIFQKHARTWNMLILYMFVSFFLAFLIIKIYQKPIPYWTLDYIEAVHDYENFFYVTLLLSGLGAIMDISITISSSLNELIEKDPLIKLDALKKSGREISKDIIGTMTNVMLFTCFTSIIPMTFLMMKNNIIIGEAIQRYGQVELIIVLTSCISIALAIPISLFISTRILKGRDK